MVTTLGNTVDESLNIRVGRFSINRLLQGRIRHIFVLSTVREDGMKCLFGYALQLIYASQPMVAGSEMALHIGYLHAHRTGSGAKSSFRD
jgi:hypothetical protein